jgi:hypothetical protein
MLRSGSIGPVECRLSYICTLGCRIWYWPGVLGASNWLDATEAGWLYGEYWPIGLALPDCGNPTLGLRISARIMFEDGGAPVAGTGGKYERRPGTGGVATCEFDTVFAVRKGDWWASIVPVGGFSTLRLCVLCSRGDLGLKMCLPVGLPGG